MINKNVLQVENDNLWPQRLFLILKCHSLTLFTIILSSTFFHEELKYPTDLYSYKVALVESSAYAVLYFTGYSFWLFLFLVFFRRSFNLFSWWFKMFFTFLMAWMSIPLMILPLLSSLIYEWYYGFIGTLAMMILHSGLALLNKTVYSFSTDFLINWIVKGFLISSLGIVASIAWKNSHIDVIIAVSVLIYTTTFIIVIGRTMGSDEFYTKEIDTNEHLFIILNHYNFVIIYSHLVLAFCKIRCILTPYRMPGGSNLFGLKVNSSNGNAGNDDLYEYLDNE